MFDPMARIGAENILRERAVESGSDQVNVTATPPSSSETRRQLANQTQPTPEAQKAARSTLEKVFRGGIGAIPAFITTGIGGALTSVIAPIAFMGGFVGGLIGGRSGEKLQTALEGGGAALGYASIPLGFALLLSKILMGMEDNKEAEQLETIAKHEERNRAAARANEQIVPQPLPQQEASAPLRKVKITVPKMERAERDAHLIDIHKQLKARPEFQTADHVAEENESISSMFGPREGGVVHETRTIETPPSKEEVLDELNNPNEVVIKITQEQKYGGATLAGMVVAGLVLGPVAAAAAGVGGLAYVLWNQAPSDKQQG